MRKVTGTLVSLLCTLNVWSMVICCCLQPAMAQPETAAEAQMSCHQPAEPPPCHGAAQEADPDAPSIGRHCQCPDHQINQSPVVFQKDQRDEKLTGDANLWQPNAVQQVAFVNPLHTQNLWDLPPPDVWTKLSPQLSQLCRYLI